MAGLQFWGLSGLAVYQTVVPHDSSWTVQVPVLPDGPILQVFPNGPELYRM